MNTRDAGPARLAIVGAGGHGREALDIVLAMNTVALTFDFVGFLDDGRKPGTHASPTDYEVIGGVTDIGPDTLYVPAIGDTRIRRRVVSTLTSTGHQAASLIHPSATVGTHVTNGPGLVMAAGARMTHAIEVGEHVHINVNASISHDCRLGSFVTITPGVHVSGNVAIGDDVWLGIGAVVRQGAVIGDGTTIGAGAVVIDDLPAGCTAVGVPARPVDLPHRACHQGLG